MNARILRVCDGELLVRGLCAFQEVRVHTPKACCFHAGDRGCIHSGGAMTMSIPPQIGADSVCRMADR